jgi:hypothetical protein
MLRRVALLFLRSVHRLLFKANVVPSSQILVTLMMQALGSPEASVLTRGTECNNPEEGIFHHIELPLSENISFIIEVHHPRELSSIRLRRG